MINSLTNDRALKKEGRLPSVDSDQFGDNTNVPPGSPSCLEVCDAGRAILLRTALERVLFQ